MAGEQGNPILDRIERLTQAVVEKRDDLDSALFAMQNWVSRRAPTLSAADRSSFSQVIGAEKSAPDRDGTPYGDDQSLVASVLRLHTMRLLYRYDRDQTAPPPALPPGSSPYTFQTRRLTDALRAGEQAINEARVDAAIANAHHILGDAGANRRWLQDALTRLESVSKIDLIRLADSVPAPPMPDLNPIQRGLFFVFGIRPAEIARRNLRSIRQLAELQTHQLIEMARLLVTSFEAIQDEPGTRQAQALLANREATLTERSE